MTEYIVELNSNVVSGNKFLLGSVYLDVEEIVRCRYCENSSHHRPWKYTGERASIEVWTCRLMADGLEIEPDGFCAWAKRRDAE